MNRPPLTLDGEPAVLHKFILSEDDSEEFREHARAQTLPFGTLVRVVLREYMRRNPLSTDDSNRNV